MAYEQREGSGALFKNDRKSDPAQPDYTGDATYKGKKVRIAAWIKDGKKGKFMSLSLQEDGDKPRAEAQRSRVEDDSIPF